MLLSTDDFDARKFELWSASALRMTGRIDALQLATNVPALDPGWTGYLGALLACVGVAAARRASTGSSGLNG